MTEAELARYFPVLYHMAADGSWESIRRHGLLSTTALLDLWGYSGASRDAIESMRRPRSVAIDHPVHGRALIRDQAPLSDAALVKCLIGMGPAEWYRILNGKVFFWLGMRRLHGLLDAKLYRQQAHIVITVDTASLLNVHAANATLSRINSGATHRGGSPRGSSTFTRVADFPFNAARRSTTSINESIAELAVDYGIPDIQDHVIAVERMFSGEVVETIYRREAKRGA